MIWTRLYHLPRAARLRTPRCVPGRPIGLALALLIFSQPTLDPGSVAKARASPSSTSEADTVESIYDRFGIDRGCFALLDLETRTWTTFGAACDEAYLPASSFKVANALIGLEMGVITGADHQRPWDGVRREHVEAWNRDHDLGSAMKYSVLWYFQAVAQEVGADGYRDYLARFDYGNRAIGGGLERFWVAGDLRITPRDQVRFLDALLRGKLPVSAQSQSVLRDIMPASESADGTERFVVRAKTGLTNQDADRVAWLIGWVESADAPDTESDSSAESEPTHVFASLLLDSAEKGWRESPTFDARSALPIEVLGTLGVIPRNHPIPW